MDIAKAAHHPKDPDCRPTIPVIQIQRPSKDPSEAGPSDSGVNTTINRGSTQTPIEIDLAVEVAETYGTDLVAVIPRATNTEPETRVAPVRIKRRKLALRKSRNALAQELS